MDHKQELLLPQSLTQFVPKSTSKTVMRTSTISTILHQIDQYNTVIVEGPKNIGKTILLSQIASDYRKDSIVLFVDERHKLSLTDSDICKDLFMQVRAFHDSNSDLNKLIPKKISLTHLKEEFSALLFSLKINKKTVTFIFDGLIDLDIKDDFIAKLFLILPFDAKVKFIISTNSNDTTKYIQGGFRKYSINVLNTIEIMEMIPKCTEIQANNLIDAYGGMPDKIATVSRLVSNGESIEDILNNDCEGAFELYQYEYNLDVNSQFSEDILGVIAFSQGKLTKTRIASMLKVSKEKLADFIRELSFVTVDGDLVDLASQGHYSYISERLKDKKIKYIDLHIENYHDGGDTDKNLPEIIRYYNEKGDLTSVISQLSEEHILNIYQESSSITELTRSIQIGLDAATAVKDEKSANKFNLLKCALTNLSKSEAVVSELECYLTEGDHSRALTLIDSNGSYEEKLQLYCIYSIYQKKNEAEIRPDVIEKINFLFEKVEKSKLSLEKASDIAADLLPVFPEKALKIINSLDELDSAGQNKSDAAFYKMSLLTLTRHGESLGDDLSKLSTTDDKRTEMFKSVEIFNPDSPADKIIEHVDKMSESGDKIFILRAWILKNFKKPASIELLKKILDIAIDATDFSIDARLFSDISMVLTVENHSCAKDDESFQRMVSHLDTLKGKGPTLEYTKLVINISIYEVINGIKNDRISELFIYLSSIGDKSIALTSLSILSLKLEKLNRLDLNDEISGCKEILFNALLSTDAFHVDIFREAIENESIYDLSNAIRWSDQLNTQDRRSKATSIALHTVFSGELNFEKYSFNDIVSLLRKVKNESFREDIYEIFLDYYFKFYETSSNYKKLIRVVNKIKSNYVKSKCLIRVLLNAKKSAKGIVDISTIRYQLDKSISATDGFENKVELYFSAHKNLYNIDTEAAKDFKNKALHLKSENFIKVSDFASYNKASVDLAIRCAYELEKFSLNSNDDILFLTSKISLLGSEIDKSYYLARLVSCFQQNKNYTQVDNIVEMNLIPLLDSYEERDSKEFAMCCYHCLPVIYFYHYDSFKSYLDSVYNLYNGISESILIRVVDYTLNDCLIYDPYNSLKKNNYPNLAHKSLKEASKVFSLAQNENTLIIVCKKILEAVRVLKRKSRISKVQIEEIISLITINYSRFPFKDGISHYGYVILLRAIVKNFDEKAEKQTWEALADDARAITNNSDRAFLLSEIASLMPEKSSHVKKSLFNESESSIKELSSELEKLNRYSILCENSFEFDKKVSQKFYKTALEVCAKGSNSNSKEAKLRFIDMVSRFDETFSSSLVTMNDDDPARVKAINNAIRRKKDRELLENKFKRSGDEDDEALAISNRNIAKVAWDSLGNINARSSHFNKTFDLSKIIANSREYSIDYYYKVLSFYIHYLTEVYKGEDNVKEHIRPIFDIIKSNILTVSKLFTLEEKAKSEVVDDESHEFLIVTANLDGIEKAKLFLHNWFMSTKCNEVTIIDPYFDYKSVEIIAEMINRDPDINVKIVTSIESFSRLKKENDEFLSDTFKKYWTDNIANGSLPSFSLQSLRYGNHNEFPIHDRWIYTDNSMLYSGGSLNGFGKKVCQIKVSSPSEMRATLEQVNPLISGQQKFFDEKKLYRSHDEV